MPPDNHQMIQEFNKRYKGEKFMKAGKCIKTDNKNIYQQYKEPKLRVKIVIKQSRHG